MDVGKAWGLSGDLGWLALSMALWGMGYGLYAVIWPAYAQHLGAGPLELGILSTVGGLLTALASIPGGWLADRMDRRQVLLWGSAVAVPVPWWFALAPHWQWLLPGVAVYFGSSFSGPSLQAYIRQAAGEGHFGAAYNAVLAAFGAGAAVGPAVGGYLAQHLSYGVVFNLAGWLYAASTAALWPLASQVPQGNARRRAFRPWERPRLWRWMAFLGMVSVLQAMAGPFVVPYLRGVGGWSLQRLGWLGSIGVLAATLSAPWWGRAGDRRRLSRVLGYGMLMVTVGWTMLLWKPKAWAWVSIAAALRGVGEASRGLLGVAVGRAVPAEEAGTAFGMAGFIGELTGALAPVGGGLLYAANPALPIALAALGGGIVAWGLMEGLPPRRPPIPATR